MVEGVLNVIVPSEGQTRMCLDPWAKVFIRASGQVCLCCNAGPIGSLNDNSLGDILNNDKAQEYRRGLLTGSPLPACQNCPERPSGSPERLIQIVQKYLDSGEMEVM